MKCGDVCDMIDGKVGMVAVVKVPKVRSQELSLINKIDCRII